MVKKLREDEFKSRNVQMRLVAEKNPNGTYTFKQVPRQQESGTKKGKWMMRMNDPRLTYWEVLIIVLAVYNSYSIPVEIAFDPAPMRSNWFTLLNSIIDLMFLLDIFV